MELQEVLKVIFEYLDKYRLALLNFILFLNTLIEGGVFPEVVIVVLTKTGLYLINHATNKKYMSFVVGKNNSIASEPLSIASPPRNGIFQILCKDGSTVIIDYPNDSITKIINGTKFTYNGKIRDRNSSNGYTQIQN